MVYEHRPTCGALFRAFEEQCQALAFLRPAEIPHGDVRLADRAIGHMRGQAEKVFLGACQAFMVRPAHDWYDWAALAMQYVCGHYGLALACGPEVGELWGAVSAPLAEEIARLLTYAIPNTRLWHTKRAAWCGIAHVDTNYHQREGYRTRCETEPEG